MRACVHEYCDLDPIKGRGTAYMDGNNGKDISVVRQIVYSDLVRFHSLSL